MKNKVPLGPYHPILEEAEYFELEVEGEEVVDLEMEVGWMHRGHEYISEQENFNQAIYLVERICGICSTSHPIACVHAIEDIDNIEIPERAQYIRSLVGEMERIHSHLLWLGLAGHFIGYDTVWMWSWKYREPVLEMMEIISGNRNHYGMMRVGGVGNDVVPQDIPELVDKLEMIEEKMNMISKAVQDDPVLKARLKGVGALTKKEARNYCAVGPVARASGINIDVRKDEPTDAYGKVDFEEIIAENGDVYDKLIVRVKEIFESISICKQCINKLEKIDGPVLNDVKEISKGEGIGRYEAPRGEVFHYIRSDGSNRALRHKIRAPSYMNIPTYKASCPGVSLSDALITLAAVDPCYCCTERALKIKSDSEEKPDLLQLSKQKTERIREEHNGN